ncbi:MAG TPA: hypothetical protein VD994_12375 [Prosthecobacter sp.]|nr:hypothetical protein [Prosthecobacter sp.]
MIRPRYLAGFTGHRDLDATHAVRQALAAELAKLKALIHERGGLLEFYASAAYGSDTMACEEAGKLGIPVHLVLPKPVVLVAKSDEVDRREGFAADFWKDEVFLQDEWDRAYRLIQAAGRGDQGGTLRLTPGTQVQPECYYDAGLLMLEAVDVLVAVWDGAPARGIGGTEHLIRLAEKRGMARIVIPASGGEAKSEGLQKLADADEASRLIFMELEEFSHDCAADAEADAAAETAEQFFDRLERCSDKHSKDFRLSLVRMILWHGTATLVAAIAAVLPQTPLPWKIVLAALAALELTLVVKAYRRGRRLHHDNTHERWMQSRFAAELMRAMKHSAGLLDPLHPLVARHQPQWRRFAITAGLMIRRENALLRWPEARETYLRERLRHPDPTIGQIAYFTSKQAAAEPLFKRTNWWGAKLGGAAIFFVVGALLFKLYVISAKLAHAPYPGPVGDNPLSTTSWLAAFCFSLLPIALPLAAGIFISLRTALDCGRRTYRYRELSERLTAAAGLIETLQTEAAIRRNVAVVEEVLLDELVEWHLAEQQNGAHG